MTITEIRGDNYAGAWEKTRTACRAIIRKDDRLLLSYETATDQWMIPGGGLEEGESEAECCRREVGEETGVLLQPSVCLFEIDEYYEDTRYISRYFTGEITGSTAMRLTERERETGMEPRWLPLGEILEIFSQHAAYAQSDEMRRGMYLREYTALCEYARLRDIRRLKLSDLQPSQFAVSDKKLDAVQSWFTPEDMSRFAAIPVKLLDGIPVMTDGHTRAAAALLAGCDAVPLAWEEDSLDWDMYRRCVAECRKNGILSPQDLLCRIVPDADYRIKWDRWCDVMQAEVMSNRALEGFILTEPSMEYDRQIQAYRKAFLRCGDSMDGCGSLRSLESTRDWIDQVEAYKSADTVPPQRVPSSQYIYVRRADSRIVGMIQIRHCFNAFLEKYGGHIGYSVCPGERRKGYATQMLKSVLPICKALGIHRVLITCQQGNEGSRRTILKNGGVYESTVWEPEEKVWLERYWIALDDP